MDSLEHTRVPRGRHRLRYTLANDQVESAFDPVVNRMSQDFDTKKVRA